MKAVGCACKKKINKCKYYGYITERIVVLIPKYGDRACKDRRRKKLKWNEHIQAYIFMCMYVRTHSIQHGD